MFENSRKCLAAKRKKLVKQELGNKHCAIRQLSDKEVDKLNDSWYIGTSTLLSLQRHLWWVISTCCGFIGRDESRKIEVWRYYVSTQRHQEAI